MKEESVCDYCEKSHHDFPEYVSSNTKIKNCKHIIQSLEKLKELKVEITGTEIVEIYCHICNLITDDF